MSAANPVPEDENMQASPETPGLAATTDTNESSHRRQPSKWDEIADKLDDLLSGPRWARLTAGTLILAVAVVAFVPQLKEAIALWKNPHNDPYQGQGTHDSTKDDPAAQPKTAGQTADQEHLNLHLTRGDGKVIGGPELLGNFAAPDELQVTYFSSDHCVRVHRHHGKDTQDKWEKEIFASNAGANASASLLVDPDHLGDFAGERNRTPGDTANRSAILPIAFSDPHIVRVQAHCLNPHPGPFRWWWGPPNGCFVPMYRQFADGCLHYQIFNSCANYWDGNINWTACYH